MKCFPSKNKANEDGESEKISEKQTVIEKRKAREGSLLSMN